MYREQDNSHLEWPDHTSTLHNPYNLGLPLFHLIPGEGATRIPQIQPGHPHREGRTLALKETFHWPSQESADAGAPILWPPDAKSPLIGKDPNAGKR